MAGVSVLDMETPSCPPVPVHQNGTAPREPRGSRPVTAPVLRVHLYHSSLAGVDSTPLSYPPGDYVVEQLCVSPLYCSLFGLFRESDGMWFSPNHVFQLDESANEDVVFRIRYYFPGWYSSGASRAYRYGVTKGSESPVLDDFVMAYLFAQVRVSL
ncbi:unnamed protein product [Coregonus sp. 'balchen']|nr:unnamed protein product [Coregonus sp. 'balchen']